MFKVTWNHLPKTVSKVAILKISENPWLTPYLVNVNCVELPKKRAHFKKFSFDYCKVFMSKFTGKSINPLIKDKSIFFLVSIKDIFLIRTKSEEERRKIKNSIDRKYQPIKFNVRFSKIEILDIQRQNQKRLQSTLPKKLAGWKVRSSIVANKNHY